MMIRALALMIAGLMLAAGGASAHSR